MRNWIVLTIIIGLVLINGLLIFRIIRLGGGQIVSSALSPDILYLTQPVFNLSGTIEKVEDNTITVSAQFNQPSGLNPPDASPKPPVALIYKILINDKTQILKNNPIIPSMVPATSSAQEPARLTINDLNVGQMVSITSTQDLRQLTGRQFEALIIAPAINNLGGRLTKIDGNILTVKDFEGKEYLVEIGPDTQIINPTAPGNNKLSDLKVDRQIIVTFEGSYKDRIEAANIQILR